MSDASSLIPAAQATLSGWHRFVESHDPAKVAPLLAEGIVFRSPYVQTPLPGRALAELVLTTVVQVFENFRYHRTFVSGDRDICLEFSGRVGTFDLKGVDLIRFDADGRMIDFEVMIRPFKALSAVGDAMNARIGPELIRLKAFAKT